MKETILFIASVLLAVTVQANTIEGFTGPYAESEWTQDIPSHHGVSGVIDFVTTNTLEIKGIESGYDCGLEVIASIEIHQAGQISFDYSVIEDDSFQDGKFIVRKLRDGETEELLNLNTTQSGAFTEQFAQGEVLELAIFTVCSCYPASVTITNFSHTTFLVPLTSLSVYLLIFLIGGFLIFRFRQM